MSSIPTHFPTFNALTDFLEQGSFPAVVGYFEDHPEALSEAYRTIEELGRSFIAKHPLIGQRLGLLAPLELANSPTAERVNQWFGLHAATQVREKRPASPPPAAHQAAIASNEEQLLQQLLGDGLFALDGEGRTALEVAKQQNNDALVRSTLFGLIATNIYSFIQFLDVEEANRRIAAEALNNDPKFASLCRRHLSENGGHQELLLHLSLEVLCDLAPLFTPDQIAERMKREVAVPSRATLGSAVPLEIALAARGQQSQVALLSSLELPNEAHLRLIVPQMSHPLFLHLLATRVEERPLLLSLATKKQQGAWLGASKEDLINADREWLRIHRSRSIPKRARHEVAEAGPATPIGRVRRGKRALERPDLRPTKRRRLNS